MSTDDLINAAIAQANAAHIDTTITEDRIAVRKVTTEGHTHWQAAGYGLAAQALTPADVTLTARPIRERHRTGIGLYDPDGTEVASDFRTLGA